MISGFLWQSAFDPIDDDLDISVRLEPTVIEDGAPGPAAPQQGTTSGRHLAVFECASVLTYFSVSFRMQEERRRLGSDYL